VNRKRVFSARPFTRSFSDRKNGDTSREEIDEIANVAIGKSKANEPWSKTKDQVPSTTLIQIASIINESRDIIVLSGAGVSVAAGIPDFRTPGTGLYDNLQNYNLPNAEAIFDIDYYRQNPQPFTQFAKEILSKYDRIHPTLTHYFISLLSKRGQLLRNYTQVSFYIMSPFRKCHVSNKACVEH
jgi:hypothetical protein